MHVQGLVMVVLDQRMIKTDTGAVESSTGRNADREGTDTSLRHHEEP